jgi:hypothetical protein
MSLGFDYDLDEIVNFDNKNISLRTAIREYKDAKKKSAGRVMLSPMWFRDQGKEPGSFDASDMDALAASIPAEDLNANNDE